jgi:hypothetical protein
MLSIQYNSRMNSFVTIDPVLSAWAMANSTGWFAEYQDTEVRTLFVGGGSRDRVQVAVDRPQQGHTVVRVGQNQRGLSRLHRLEVLSTSIEELSTTLDHALLIADSWLAEGSEGRG